MDFTIRSRSRASRCVAAKRLPLARPNAPDGIQQQVSGNTADAPALPTASAFVAGDAAAVDKAASASFVTGHRLRHLLPGLPLPASLHADPGQHSILIADIYGTIHTVTPTPLCRCP
ncbi:MAG: hypothetical protein QM674_01030 [Burkholderiaceae bacterium]